MSCHLLFSLGSSHVDFGLTIRGIFGPETGVSAAQTQQTVPGMAQGFAGELKYPQFSNSLCPTFGSMYTIITKMLQNEEELFNSKFHSATNTMINFLVSV